MALSGLVVLAACSRAAPPVEIEPRASPGKRAELALEDYLPPAGLQLAVHLHPRALLRHPRLGPELRAFLPDARLDAFRVVTGVELRELSEMWFAEYDLGTLYLVPFAHAEALAVRYRERSESQGPERRWSATLTSCTLVRRRSPFGLVVDQGLFSALVEKDLSLGRLIVARALGKLDKLEPPLRRLGLSELGDDDGGLATVFWVGQPRLVEADRAELEPAAPEHGAPEPTALEPAAPEPRFETFSDSIDVGRLALFDEDGKLRLKLHLRLLSETEPLPEFRAYLEELTARPEIRVVLGNDLALSDLACSERSTTWVCGASVDLDLAALGRSWGNLLQGGLDSF